MKCTVQHNQRLQHVKELVKGIKESGCDWVRDDGKVTLYDGRTGEPFDEPVAVGFILYPETCPPC